MEEPVAGPSTSRDACDAAAGSGRKAPTCRVQAGRILGEGVIVALTGALFAFAANEVSPGGLALARNYFPGAIERPLPTTNSAQLIPGTGETNVAVASAANLLAARLQAKGLQLLEQAQVAQRFRDPRYEQELIVFIDARDDRHYQEGHIPGAYQFDHYHPEKHLATVLPVCQAAEEIVVYCTGGDCEDSEFASIFLRDAGIPGEKLFVYGGGMTEWSMNGLPVETGERKSGNLRPARP